MDMSVIIIILSLAGLIALAYRGFSVIMMAPIMALLAATLSGLAIMPSYTELFMGKAVTFIKSFFPVFLLGAIFGKVMEDMGLAKSIANAIITKLGKDPRKAILSIVISSVVFAVYPFAAALFKEADYPKRLIPGIIALGAFTATVDCLPGSPQIQNIIPTAYFGTTLYSAPVSGIIGACIIYCLGFLYFTRCLKRAIAKNEGYGNHTINEPEYDANDNNLVSWKLACIPLLAVLIINFVITEYVVWHPAILEPFQSMKGVPLVVAHVKNVASIWSLIIALVIGIFLALIIGKGEITSVDRLTKVLNAGAIGSLLAIMNTASEVGITTLAGMTGSASGGMAIALELMAQDWMAWANTLGMSPDILHRVASMAAGGLDTLPHNGAVITLLAICGLTHRTSYKNIFVITLLKTATVFVIILIYSLTGIY